MIQDEAAEAEAIADLVGSLAMLHGDPERFHVVKDEAAYRLRQMAKRLRGDGRRRVLRLEPRTPEARRGQIAEGDHRGTTWRSEPAAR